MRFFDCGMYLQWLQVGEVKKWGFMYLVFFKFDEIDFDCTEELVFATTELKEAIRFFKDNFNDNDIYITIFENGIPLEEDSEYETITQFQIEVI